MNTIWQDLRYSARMLRKRPGFALLAVLTLTLGIGANTAIFSVINVVLLQALPYPSGDRLVAVWMKLQQTDQVELSPDEFADFQTANRSFVELAAAERANLNLTGAGEPVRLEGQAITANLFPALGVRPLLGRSFTPEEDRAGARVAVLSYELWQARFGGQPDIVGKTMQLDGKNYDVIGVMPGEFQFPPPGVASKPGEIWVPRALEIETARNAHNLLTIGLLKPGVTVAQAQSDIATLAQQREARTGNGPGKVNLVALQAQVGRQLRPALLLLAGAVGFVLLIACANVANMLLTAAAARQQEISVRLALGASRWRIVRQMLTESLLLSLTGAVLGLLLATWGCDALQTLGASQLPRADQIQVNGSVLVFTLALAVLTGLGFGLAPALNLSRAGLYETLKEGGRSGQDAGRRSWRNALITAEVALSLMLLLGAGLMLRSFWQLLQVAPGFNAQNLLSVELSLPQERYATPALRATFYQQLLERLQTLPGVQSAAIVNHPPFSGRRGINAFLLEGQSESTRDANLPLADFRVISPAYFQMMGIPLLQGRALTAADQADAQPVAVINQAFADKYWPGENPLGRRLRIGDEWTTIVGIAANIRQSGLDQEAAPHVYAPYQQLPLGRTGLLVRTTVEPLSLVSAVRQQVLSLDASQPIYNLHTMEELIAGSLATRRLNLLLLGVFALTALVLAAVGIYGVISYAVAQRHHEIGIRMALGAQRRDVLALVIKQGMTPVVAGMAIGLVGTLALTRVLAAFVVGINATDPLTLTSTTLLLGLVALLACYFPARRASTVDPLVALRYE